MRIRNIKKNDTVMAITGTNKGKTGKVLHVLPVRERVIVEGLNMIKKTLRKSQDNPQGGIIEKEGSVAVSNLSLYCPDCKKGVRVGRRRDGAKNVRFCRLCKAALDD